MSNIVASSSSMSHTRDTVAPDLRDTPHHDKLAHLPSASVPSNDVVFTDKFHVTKSQRRRTMINQYEFGRIVGKGQHGEVYLAQDTTQDNILVVRTMLLVLSSRPTHAPFPVPLL